MNRALKDENFVNSLLGVSNADGSTLDTLVATASTHGLLVSDGSTGSNLGPPNAPKDGNGVSAIMAVSSTDGSTPVVLYTNAAGKLLVKST